MKMIVFFLTLMSAQLAFADHYEFFVRNGALLLSIDIPATSSRFAQPIRVEVRDSQTHELVERENTWVEVSYYLPGTKFETTMNPMNGYLDRCQATVPGRVCGTMHFAQPGKWNIAVSFKEFHGDTESQVYAVYVDGYIPTPR
ncbi:hypothetical protein [Bdellovibrio sp. NC01]|uniref:hypothetical protein n=1 Tax=Bdellovibrio sp. NC01 TaxID=2220073 RepID=UPI001159F16B|nr:hypothetical protein [Bdellovibrio sp. NC01]QDK38192.1 hypothetical protein DOE51_11660 [Bdellovibrio sp. NC01]